MDKFQLPKDTGLAQQVLDNEQKRHELGVLGKFFGANHSSANNIAGTTVIVLILTGIGYTIFIGSKEYSDKDVSIKEFWGIITPIITLVLGYIFGKKDS